MPGPAPQPMQNGGQQPTQPNIYDQSAGAYNGALGAVNGALAQNAMRGPGFASTATYSPITGQAALGQASTGQAQGYNAQMMGPSSMNAAQSNFTAQAQGYNPAMMQATTGQAQGYNPATGTATTYQAGNLGNAATYNAQQANSQGFNAAQQSPAAQMSAAQIQQTPGAQSQNAGSTGFSAAQIDPSQGYSATNFDRGNLQNVNAGRVSKHRLEPVSEPVHPERDRQHAAGNGPNAPNDVERRGCAGHGGECVWRITARPCRIRG
jgi:hypothetical protein